MAWMAEKHPPGQPLQPIRFEHWSDDRSDNDIADDAIGRLELAHEILRDAAQAGGVQLGPLYGADHQNPVRARAFFESHLTSLRPGALKIISTDDVHTWLAQYR